MATQGTSAAELKKVYRKLALQHHPDKNPDQSEESKEVFQKIVQAYKTLEDPWKRKYYEETGSVEDIDMTAESYMAAFVEMVDEMVGGARCLRSKSVGVSNIVNFARRPNQVVLLGTDGFRRYGEVTSVANATFALGH